MEIQENVARQEVENTSQNPIRAAFESIQIKQKTGDLSSTILIVVIIYNFLFFELGEGRELYILVPALFGIASYYSKFWLTDTKKQIRLVGIVITYLALIIDLIVSFSYIPDPTGGFSFGSIPTLVLDLLGLLSLSVWIFRKSEQTTISSNNNSSEDGLENISKVVG